MLEKLRPFVAMMFCATLGAITIVTNLILAFKNGTPAQGVDFVFYCFLPICFFFVGEFLTSLRKENLVLRSKIEELSSKLAEAGTTT